MSSALDVLRLPLHGIQLIEASAGTGKTHSIIWLYLRCIVERNLRVGAVLVVTFTEAATGEVKRRLLEHLHRALAWLEQDLPPQVLMKEAASSGDTPPTAIAQGERRQIQLWLDQLARLEISRSAAAERVALAIAEWDQAAVYTIHGFCRRVLADCALQTGAAFAEYEPSNDTQLQSVAVADFWREQVLSASPSTAAWALRWWRDPAALLKALQPVIGRYGGRVLPADPEAEIVRAAASLSASHAQVAALWEQRDLAVALLPAKQFGLSTNKEDGFSHSRLETFKSGMDAWLAAGPFAGLPPPGLEMLAPAALAALQTKSAVKAGKPLPQHPLLDALGRLAEHAATYQRLLRAGLLYAALQFVRRTVQRRQQELNALGFDAMIDRVWTALHGASADELAALLRKRYPIAMVDEFQDTDQAQYAIFRRIYLEHGTLIAIGDPKQAIYAFRGGDIFAYGQARHDVGSALHSLPDNYRAEPALTEALNRIFRSRENVFGQDFIEFVPVGTRGPKGGRALTESNTPQPPVVIWHVAADAALQDRRTKTPQAAAGKFSIAICAAVATEIVRLIDAGRAGAIRIGAEPLAARDIAVLVRNRHEGEAIAAALRERGVACARKGIASVFATSEADELALLLRSLLDPSDAGRLRAALATELLGGEVIMPGDPAAHLHWQEVLAQCVERRRVWEADGPLAMLAPVLRSASARFLSYTDGERRMTNLRHLAELLQVASTGCFGVAGLGLWYEAQREAADANFEAQQLRLESDGDVVQILTMHGSKGLEFPVLFAPFLWHGRAPKQSPPPLVAHDDNLGALIDLGSEHWAAHAGAAQRGAFFEDVRLAYVALTRAINRLYLVWGKVDGGQYSALAWLLHTGEYSPPAPHPHWSVLDDVAIAATLNALCAAGSGMRYMEMPAANSKRLLPMAEPIALAARSFVGSIAALQRVQSFSALLRGDSHAEARDRDRLLSSEEGDSIVQAPALRGPLLGEVLHAVLEQMDFAAGATAAHALIAEQRRRAGLVPAAEALLQQWVGATLAAEVVPNARLGEIDPSQRVAEIEFHFRLDGADRAKLQRLRDSHPDYAAALALLGEPNGRLDGWMHGYIDLVFEYQGSYYVVDYKSNWLGDSAEDYAEDSLHAAMQEHRYDLQALIYLVALHRHLGHCLGDAYAIDRHLGAALWLFVRGLQFGARSGLYRMRPPTALLLELDGWLGGVEGRA